MKKLFTGLSCPTGEYIHTPLIEIVPVADPAPLWQATADVSQYDYLLFTSRFAVKYWVEAANQARNNPWGGGHTTIVSIGDTTSQALRKAGATGFCQCRQDNSYGVISWFQQQKEEGKTGSVLFPRSAIALPLIPDGLAKSGFTVRTVAAYNNQMPENPIKVDLDTISHIIFTSPSTIDNFIRLYGHLPGGKQYETRGPVTQSHLEMRLKQQELQKTRNNEKDI